jgi:DNA invertase Pin-like site-specific DNA recombinase
MKHPRAPQKPVAVGYVRISAKGNGESTSLASQRELVIRECALGGFDLLRIFEDDGVSGMKGEGSRPGLAAALDAVRSGAATVLIVAHADRLARSSDLAGHYRVVVQEAGGRVVVVAEAKDDPIRCALDRMIAEIERIRGSQRMKVWHAHRKAHALPAGPAPFGFEKGEDGRLRANVAEAKVVQHIKRLRRTNSLRAIADRLNREGITMRGRPWNAVQILRVLRQAAPK